MGDVADMILDGTLCEGCGVYLEGESYGVPRRCRACNSGESRVQGLKIACPTCGKRVKTTGLKDHQRDVHSSGPGKAADHGS